MTEKKQPISKAEWQHARKVLTEISQGGDGGFRKLLINKFKAIYGQSPCPKRTSIGIVYRLIRDGYLKRPEWHDLSTLTLSLIPTDELLEAYNWLKFGIAPEGEPDEENPF